MNISKEGRQNLMRVQKYIGRLSEAKQLITRGEEEEAKGAALKVLAEYTGKLDEKGLPQNFADRAIIQALVDNRTRVVEMVERVTLERHPTPVDFYTIYYEVLKDSGLLKLGLVEPDLLARIERWRVTQVSDACSACNACGACGACAVCAACAPTGVGATGVAGVAVVAVGTAGVFF